MCCILNKSSILLWCSNIIHWLFGKYLFTGLYQSSKYWYISLYSFKSHIHWYYHQFHQVKVLWNYQAHRWIQFSKILIFTLLLVTNFVFSFPWSTQVHIIHFDVKNAKSSGINNPSLSVMHSLKWKWCSMKKNSEFSSTPSVTGVLLPEVSTGDRYEEVLSVDFLIFTYNVRKMWSQGSKINVFFFFFFASLRVFLSSIDHL